MFPKYIPIELDDGSVVYYQSINAFDGKDTPASGDKTQKIADVMRKAMSPVAKFAGETKKALDPLDFNEIELEFSVTITTDMNAVIASAGAESGITVHMVWKKKP